MKTRIIRDEHNNILETFQTESDLDREYNYIHYCLYRDLKRELDVYRAFANRDIKAQVEEYLEGNVDFENLHGD